MHPTKLLVSILAVLGFGFAGERFAAIQGHAPFERGHLGSTLDNCVCVIVRKITLCLIGKMQYNL
jgi:hypothetical protein